MVRRGGSSPTPTTTARASTTTGPTGAPQQASLRSQSSWRRSWRRWENDSFQKSCISSHFCPRWRVWHQPILRQPLLCLTRRPLLSRHHTTPCPAGASPSQRPSRRRPRAPPTFSTTRPSSRPPSGSPTLPCQRLGRSRRTLCRLPKFPRLSQARDLLTIKPMAPLPLILIASLLMAAALLVSFSISGCQINNAHPIRFPNLSRKFAGEPVSDYA